MLHKVKFVLMLGFILSLSVTAFTHDNFKRVKEGVISKESSKYFITSPADKYEIRPQDNNKVQSFISQNKSNNVRAELTRKSHNDLWTVKSLSKR